MTWVSGTGKDAGNCAVTAPCVTLRYAYSQTASSGTILAISSGSYGRINIVKPINIIASDGVDAVVTAYSNDNGINVNTSGAVLLKGLRVVANSPNDPSGMAGIGVLNGSVVIDHVTVVGVTIGVYQQSGFLIVKSCVLASNATGVHVAAAVIIWVPARSAATLWEFQVI